MGEETIIQRGSCLLRIKGVYDSLKTAEKNIADYVLQYPEETIHSTMEELAEKSNSSYATIFRFCKKIGFSGYKEFKDSLIHDVMTNRNVGDFLDAEIMNPNASTAVICQKVYDFSFKVLEDSLAIIDVPTIDQAVETILKAPQLLFIGAGTSGVSAHYAFTKFFRLGIPCFAELDATLYKMKTAIMRSTDVLFAISSSGRTASIVDAAHLAKGQNATVISLSDFAISPLSKVSDITLFTTPRNTNLFKDIEMPLIMGQIAIINLLYSCCCVRMADRAVELYNKTKTTADTEKI